MVDNDFKIYFFLVKKKGFDVILIKKKCYFSRFIFEKYFIFLRKDPLHAPWASQRVKPREGQYGHLAKGSFGRETCPGAAESKTISENKSKTGDDLVI